ncbi:MAG: CocE/NonD family hydrolase [Novosphingobium sp.]|nr:CocE/NonD family hydrolase [Novosphingobium sp.]
MTLLLAVAISGSVSQVQAQPVAGSFHPSYQHGLYGKGPAPSTEGVTCSVEKVPMRDGVKLSTEVTRPAKPGKYPVIMMRTPYLGAEASPGCVNHPYWPLYGPGSRSEVAARGYVTILQEVRGTSRSEGEFHPVINEADDGYDAIEWSARQPWSTGKVGMYQGSYHAMVQWQAAIARPPHLVTIIPNMSPTNPDSGWPLGPAGTFPGLARMWAGNMSVDLLRRKLRAEGASAERIATESAALAKQVQGAAFAPPAQALPLATDPIFKDIPFYQEWLKHPTVDAYWKDAAVLDKLPTVSIPVLSVGSWYDVFIRGSIDGYVAMQDRAATPEARANARLVVAGAGHAINFVAANLRRREHETLGAYIGDITFGAENLFPEDLGIRWYDYWLKGIQNGVMDEPAVKLYVMVPPDQGSVGTGFWVTGSKYPLPSTQTVRYYIGGGRANSMTGGGKLALAPSGAGFDQFRYDPANPVPSIGGTFCCAFSPAGAFDQRPVEMRADVLVYTSEALTKALPVIGEVSVTLKASSTVPSTAFTAKLVDLHPDGYAQIISDGIVVTPATQPNAMGTYTIRLTPTGTVFKPGHKIRLEVSSSSYPQFVVHTNTTDPIATAKNLVVATQTVHWTGTSLNLPVAPVTIPPSALDPSHPANSLQAAIAAEQAARQP